MDQIYLSSALTIVAGDADSAYGGLTGFRPGSRVAQQDWAQIAGLTFVGITPPILDELKELPWHKRAWTYQGGLSRLYFNCAKADFREQNLYYQSDS